MTIASSFRAMFQAGDIPAAPSNRNPSDDFWYDDSPARAGAIRVAGDTVVQIPEVYDCLQVISQAVAQLPLPIYRRTPDGGKKRAPEHPLYDLLHHRPNELQTAYEFRAQMTWDLCLHRNAFAEIKEGRRGPIDSLTRLDPERVVVKTQVRTDGGVDHVYEHMLDDGRWRRLLPEQVFHLRAPPLISSNLLGRSLIVDGKRTFARALAIQEFVTNFFENDATPSSIITTQKPFVNQDEANNFRKKWLRMFRMSRKNGAPAVLDGATSFQVVHADNAKAQVMEAYAIVALQCIRFWRMPPHKIGILDKATFSNIEQQALEFVVDTLMPWLVAWEQGIRRDLIMRRDDFFAEHNVGGLLRGDLKARYDAYAQARNWGWLSVNDIRSLENLNPIPEGDVYLQPLNMVPAGSQHAERAAFIAYVDREQAITAALDAYRAPRLIGHNGGPALDAVDVPEETAAQEPAA